MDNSSAGISEELDYLKSLIESVDNQLSVLVRGMEEYNRALLVLKENYLKDSRDVKVSIGAGIYLKADIHSDEKLFVPIGSDLYIEEDSKTTLSRLDRNIKEIQDSVQNIQQRRYEITERYNTLISAVQRQIQQPQER
ncbi:MAG: prefoldin subunit alpha [Candidatus Thermoplasmatota archaeon]|nr:prefoldin subunit alpha [Candidatus Thermoplasmatota archaeon]